MTTSNEELPECFRLSKEESEFFASLILDRAKRMIDGYKKMAEESLRKQVEGEAK